MPPLLLSGGGVVQCSDMNLSSDYVKPREASPCTAYLYTKLPNYRIIAPPSPRHSCTFETDRIEGIFEHIREPVRWPSTIDSLWSNPLLTAVEEVWTDFGNTLSDIKEPALKDRHQRQLRFLPLVARR